MRFFLKRKKVVTLPQEKRTHLESKDQSQENAITPLGSKKTNLRWKTTIINSIKEKTYEMHEKEIKQQKQSGKDSKKILKSEAQKSNLEM